MGRNARNNWLLFPAVTSPLPSPQRVFVCFDKFKGALTAREAGEVTAAVIRRARPTWQIDSSALSDGGDGFCAIVTAAAGGTLHDVCATTATHDPAGRAERAVTQIGLVELSRLAGSVRRRLGLGSEVRRLAVVEMAAINGLAQVPEARRDVWRASSFGTGELLLAAVAHGAEAVLLGIGGSATSDLGLGALCALGLSFGNRAGERFAPPLPGDWHRIGLVSGRVGLGQLPLRVACDVDNPLLGARGAAASYGPQKGLSREDLARFDAEAARMAALLCEHLGVEHALADVPGAGAAGGMGFALLAAANARLVPGFELVADVLALDERLRRADCVITGEGCFDASSLRGKGPGALLMRARRLGRNCVVFAGTIAEAELEVDSHGELIAISAPETPRDEAMAQTRLNLAAAVERWLQRYPAPG
jgi:glycerate 2-kinase